jgi:hypothetical protein
MLSWILIELGKLLDRISKFQPKKHKLWLNNGCPKILDQRKHAKLQRLQDPSKINWDNMNNIRPEARRHFRNKKREYLRENIDELAMNSNKCNRDL